MLNPQQFPMNREQRRKHYRDVKKDPDAVYCPHCTHKTKHVAIPSSSKSQNCDVVCVACGNVLRADIPGLVPYEYVAKVPPV